MKNRIINGKEPVTIIAFLQDFKAPCNACNIHESAAMWPFKNYLSVPVESVIKNGVAIRTQTAGAQEAYFTSHFAIVNYLLRLYATDENIAAVDADIWASRQELLTSTY